MALLRIPEQPSRLERILIYGDPKTGKTRLATSLTPRFGDIIYFAAEPGAEFLTPVLSKYRSRIHLVKPSGNDPDKDAFTFCLNDWKKEFPSANTIVWDSLTATALDLLRYIADKGQFSDKAHIVIGSDAYTQNIPMQGDYMAAQARVIRLLDFLFRQPMHILVICHATYDAPEDAPTEGGPDTIGKAKVRTLPGRFDTVLYTTRQVVPPKKFGDPSESKFLVYGERYKIWNAGIRSGHAHNPMPLTEMPPDPGDVWQKFDHHFLLPTLPALPPTNTEPVTT